MKKSILYDDHIIEHLKDPKRALAYLNAILEDYREDDPESQQLLLVALRNVVKAQGGIAKLAEKTGLGRESLYKTLSEKGNPKFSTLTTLMNALGFNLQVSLADPA